MHSILLRQGVGMALGALLMAAVLTVTQAHAQEPVSAAGTAEVVTPAADAPYTIHYQGQLFNPNTGSPLSNRTFTALFALHANASGNSAVWGEQKTITTDIDGLFNTQLGDTIGFNLGLFDGRELYLEISIDGEATRPLQPLTYVPYALWARTAANADRLQGFSAGDFAKIVAYGFVDASGSRESGSNFNSFRDTVRGQRVYLIDIGGVDYHFRDYTTLVTPACSDPAAPVFVGTGSSEGDLVVDMWDINGNRTTCNFQFMTLRRE